MMPGISGFEVCERIRQVFDTPLIMLTALNHEQEMLRGLEAGADILLARAKTVLAKQEYERPKH
jgi:DNA-binding response OmpR family regulator